MRWITSGTVYLVMIASGFLVTSEWFLHGGIQYIFALGGLLVAFGAYLWTDIVS